MKKIITNNYNLNDKDMTEVVQRVKLLLINSKKEVLLGYSHNEYQFPGGHVEQGENLNQAAKRELLEETGINLNLENIEPFACAIGYYKDWPAIDKNRKIEIYYYEIETDERPNLANTSYTQNEKDGQFKLQYVPLSNIENILKNNINQYEDKHGIAKEMLELIKIYKENNN